MGYTHYYTHTKVEEDVWNKITKDCQLLIDGAEKEGVFVDGYGVEDKPIVNDDQVFFNGTDEGFTMEDHKTGEPDNSYETFVMNKSGSDFAFCKTARKPYDLIVCACLLAYVYHSEDTMDLRSDGFAGANYPTEDEWYAAEKYFNKITGHDLKVDDLFEKEMI